MPNRYKGKEPDNIRNTDNEDTMLIPDGIDSYPDAHSDLPPLRKTGSRTSRPRSSWQLDDRAQQQTDNSVQQRPQYRREQQPPQFPHSSRPPQQYYEAGNEQYFDYAQQPPGNSEGYHDTDGYVTPPTAPRRRNQSDRNIKDNDIQSNSEEKPKKKKRRHKSLAGKIIRRILRIFLILFLLLFGIYSCTSVALIRKVNKQPSEHRTHYADSVGRGHVRNILVIGTDGRTADDKGRSDSMILVSLNYKTNEIIMTSFMRDSYVEIPDNGWNKLNAAYAFGGADLLMETIEYNFDVRIDDYVSVDFASFVSVVDAVGGIDIQVSDAEAEAINIILISEVNQLMGDDRNADLLDGGGMLHLNGKQALSYSRIRYVGNSDFERTERQRRVMSLIFAKLKSFKPSIFKNLASDVIPDVTTNMSSMKMYLLSLRLPFLAGYDTKQIQIPAEGTYYGADVDVGNVLEIDRKKNQDIIDDEVFAER